MDTNTKARLVHEHDELDARIEKLESFITGNVFESLPEDDRADLREQLRHMRAYSTVLARRMRRHTKLA
jgi:hypothetical protein